MDRTREEIFSLSVAKVYRVVAAAIWDSGEAPSFSSLRSGGIPSSSIIIFLFRSLSPANDASELAASTRSLSCVECWTVAMLDQTHASTGSLLAMGGRERFTPALSSWTKTERSHLRSAMEDSRRFETFRTSAAVVMVKT